MSGTTKNNKVRLWRAALALSGEREADVCKRFSTSRAMVYFVLRDKAKSRRVEKQIHAFIAKHLPAQCPAQS
jgi:hypothetical protein